MSIVRIGMSEDGKFGNGYDAIFGKKDAGTPKEAAKKTAAKKPTVKKVATAKKSAAKKK